MDNEGTTVVVLWSLHYISVSRLDGIDLVQHLPLLRRGCLNQSIRRQPGFADTSPRVHNERCPWRYLALFRFLPLQTDRLCCMLWARSTLGRTAYQFGDGAHIRIFLAFTDNL